MANERRDGINQTIRLKDERGKINLIIETATGDVEFLLFFNPADPYFYEHFAALEEIEMDDTKLNKMQTARDMRDGLKPLTSALDEHFDAIFGDGTARKLFKYSGVKKHILNAVMLELGKGIEDFLKESEAEEKAAKLAAVLEAKKSAAPYIAPVK